MHLCNECGINHATIHVTYFSGESTVVSRLCDACARKKGISISIVEDGPLLSCKQPSPAEGLPAAEEVECAGCGLPFSEFESKGRLGCPECYSTFEKEIDALLRQMHGTAVHKGKICPKKHFSTDVKDIRRLRAELEEAVKTEAFERAAAIRDVIRSLSAADTLEEQPRNCSR